MNRAQFDDSHHLLVPTDCLLCQRHIRRIQSHKRGIKGGLGITLPSSLVAHIHPVDSKYIEITKNRGI